MKAGLKMAGVALLATLALGGCANEAYNGNTYSGSTVMGAQAVSYGTITSIRGVKIQDQDKNGFGALSGGVLGGFLGHVFGNGSGRDLATAAGAVGGALVGNQVQNSTQNTNGMEVQVKRDDGQSLVIVQAADNSYHVGQRVRLIGSGSQVRVAPY
ncbi:Outer membrane lipoprotein SlyB [Halomonadaceae bacterium LMG 33818]|uniref:glycine zipper 2TM domain-containing protein n=1 Tax=Cernens ardua TaxID=3402176 RepID=UPI003EDB9EDC